MTYKDNLRDILIAYKHGHYDLEEALNALKPKYVGSIPISDVTIKPIVPICKEWQEFSVDLRPKKHHITIRLNRRIDALIFTTGYKVSICEAADIVSMSMDPSEFLNTFLSWDVVQSISVKIEK